MAPHAVVAKPMDDCPLPQLAHCQTVLLIMVALSCRQATAPARRTRIAKACDLPRNAILPGLITVSGSETST